MSHSDLSGAFACPGTILRSIFECSNCSKLVFAAHSFFSDLSALLFLVGIALQYSLHMTAKRRLFSVFLVEKTSSAQTTRYCVLSEVAQSANPNRACSAKLTMSISVDVSLQSARGKTNARDANSTAGRTTSNASTAHAASTPVAPLRRYASALHVFALGTRVMSIFMP